jgi:hypothetical protein
VTSSERTAPPEAKAYHHGRTPAAWAGSIMASVAFVLGAIGFVTGPNLTLLWIAAVLLVLSVVVGGVLRRMGFGQS